MRKWQYAAALVALAGLASPAMAANGDIVFTNQTDDSIKLLSGGSVSTLVSFADPSVRLAGITRAGNGRWYVANGPIVPTPTSGQIFEIDDIFSATPTVSVLASGNPTQNPIALRWDAARGVLFSVNNPGEHGLDPEYDGIIAYGLDGAVTQVWSEPENPTPPSYFDGVWLANLRDGSGDYMVVAQNGGAFGGNANLASSTVWRLSVDGSLTGSMSLLADLGDTAALGIAESILDSRGIAVTDSGRIFITGKDTGKVYEVDLSSGFSITEIASGIDHVTRIEYDRFNDRLVLAQQEVTIGFGQISTINLDGSGFAVLATGVSPRDLYIIPSPASLALLGIGGLAASRRRR